MNWPESETLVGAPGHASAPGGLAPGAGSAPPGRPTVSLPAFSGAVGGLARLSERDAALAALIEVRAALEGADSYATAA